MAEEYPRDEFDQIAQSGGPVGVHRAPRPWWIAVVIPVLVFLVAGLAAYLVATFLWNSGGTKPQATPTVSETVTTEPTTEPSEPATSETAEPTASSEPEPSETAAPEPVVDLATPVAVLNGAGVQGLAATQQAVLEEAGFTSVTATNLSGTKPEANRVVYGDAEQEATAQSVAQALGIDTVSLGSTSATGTIDVQLVTDPR